MIRSKYSWGVGEWVIVLLWKVLTLSMAGVMAYLGITEPGAMHVIGFFYAALFFGAFVFTQPDV